VIETATRSDNFFYKKVEIYAPAVDETDWTLLQAAYSGDEQRRRLEQDVEF
jgi:hypothetical protein